MQLFSLITLGGITVFATCSFTSLSAERHICSNEIPGRAGHPAGLDGEIPIERNCVLTELLGGCTPRECTVPEPFLADCLIKH